jgi:site-specific recombinase XerD
VPLTLYRRHARTCKHAGKLRRDARSQKCDCVLWVQGSLAGAYLRQSLDLTSWEAAQNVVRGWEATGEVGVAKAEIPSIEEAVQKFLAYTKARNRSWETLRKYENLLERRFLSWCREKGYRHLKQVSVDTLRTFQTTWKDGPVYAGKNIERLRSFFRFCHDAEWIKSNPATALKAPSAKPNPTLPFTAQEMKKILAACDRYRGDKARIKAFILVMRHAGLRIGDAIALTRARVAGNKLFLYTQKTGTPVSVPLPPVVVKALKELPNGQEHYFWSGKNIRSAVSNWSRYLASVFELAGVKDAHSHRFRDTFAVSLLEKGVSLENVSVLLGHSSVKITERHYSPWVSTRQEQLEAAVKRAWS